jgi:uncharacterized protein YlaN (UPF0358 family)
VDHFEAEINTLREDATEVLVLPWLRMKATFARFAKSAGQIRALVQVSMTPLELSRTAAFHEVALLLSAA